MIPSIIHYCWFGKAEKSPLLKSCIDSWGRSMPDFQISEWNDSNCPVNNFYTEQARAQGLWSKLSDYVRLHVLYTQGGIYLDTDVEVTRSMAPLLSLKCFVGFQEQKECADWVNNAVLGAESGHVFLKKCMDLTIKLHENKEKSYYASPTITTVVLKEMGLKVYGSQEVDGVQIFPLDYFYPYPWYGKLSRDCITENTYSIHHWDASWKNKNIFGEVKKALFRLRVLK